MPAGIYENKNCNGIKKTGKFIPLEHQKNVTKYFLKGEYKGLLLFHELGSGKSCTSIMIADEMLRRGDINKVFIITPGSLRDGWVNEYCKVCGDNKKILNEKYVFMTYNYHGVLKNLDKYNFNKSLVIIDEVHNVINGVKNSISQIAINDDFNPILEDDINLDLMDIENPDKIVEKKKEKTNMKLNVSIYNKIMKSKCRVLALSGTPIFKNIYEWPLLERLLNPTNEFIANIINKKTNKLEPGEFLQDFDENLNNGTIFLKDKTKNRFIRRIGGIISYYPGKVGSYPRVVYKDPVQVRMNKFQNNNYWLKAINEKKTRESGFPIRMKGEKKKEFDLRKQMYIVSLLYVQSRVASNCYYPKKYMLEPDKIKKEGGWVSKENIKNRELYNIFSPKMTALVLNIIFNFDRKHVVYTFAKTKSGVDLINALFKLCNINTLIFSGDISEKNERSDILKKFNSESNRYGDEYKVLLITDAGAEGITVLEATHMHLLESSPRPTLIKQAIGRVVRFKSHINLPIEEQVVFVWRYWSISSFDGVFNIKEKTNNKEGDNNFDIITITNNKTVDVDLYEKGQIDLNRIMSFLKILQLSSIETNKNTINWEDEKQKILDMKISTFPSPPPPLPYYLSSEKISSEKISSEKISSEKISSEKISSEKISSEKIPKDLYSNIQKCRPNDPFSREFDRIKINKCRELLCNEVITNKKTYRKWALNNHPDKIIGEGNKVSTEMFKRVSDCYENNFCCLNFEAKPNITEFNMENILLYNLKEIFDEYKDKIELLTKKIIKTKLIEIYGFDKKYIKDNKEIISNQISNYFEDM
jgi:superfamily II DNA or RNA helicase